MFPALQVFAANQRTRGSESEKARGVIAQDQFSLCVGQTYFIENMHWLVVSHIEAVIASDHNSLGTHLTYHEVHHGLRVDDRVEHKTPQIFAGGLRQVQFLDFWTDLRAMVNPSDQH